MEKGEKNWEAISEIGNYLMPGEQTCLPEDEKWQELVASIEGKGIAGAIACASALRDRLQFKMIQPEKWRRDVRQIWESGHYTGCTDLALVTAALARTKKIPAKIFTTVYRPYRDSQKSVSPGIGHTAIAVYENNDWWVIDPTDWTVPGIGAERLPEDDHWPKPEERVRLADFEKRVPNFTIIGEGKDLWEMGIKSGRDFENKAAKKE